jgi:hypothetical protein
MSAAPDWSIKPVQAAIAIDALLRHVAKKNGRGCIPLHPLHRRL